VIDDAHALVVRVRHLEVAGRVQGDAARAVELCPPSRGRRRLAEDRDMNVQHGMEAGARETYQRLEEVIAGLAARV